MSRTTSVVRRRSTGIRCASGTGAATIGVSGSAPQRKASSAAAHGIHRRRRVDS